MPRPSRRSLIRKVIRRRIAGGEPLTIRAIQEETGGSNSTVKEELDEVLAETPDLVSGARANSPPERVREMQQCIHRLTEENTGLESEVGALTNALKLFRDELQGLMGNMVFTNREVLKGLDDVRQTVARLRPQNTVKPQTESGREIYLTEKLNQATRSVISLTEKVQFLESKLAEAGIDV